MPAIPNNIEATSVMDLFSLKGKITLVLGGSRGIGAAVVRAFAEAGATVYFTYKSSNNCKKMAKDLAEKYDVPVFAVHCDATDEKSIQDVISNIAMSGNLDVVVSNAGICISKSGIDMTTEEFNRTFALNVNGVFLAARAAGKVFKRQGFGSFIATASMSGSIVNVPQKQCAYNASKAAVIQLCKSLAIEWADFARVNTVSPGYIITDMSESSLREEWIRTSPFKRMAKPDELKGAYVYLASDASSFTSGSDLLVDGAYSCL
ncbi:short chain dehydrogenase [Schizosaccharomyces japonicus yFS275]|uniref:Short chain dehydrogenase n=1 Tax=Schizosaccharomyces japonicus (strain yFS275 / FY16936) TaxID=402676 RepID=B6K8F4_SCHJY|nr:short chain dehydrogenase [Schizosaccharomyces japonicus yFS275]EEB09808.2 short chain dehydrogenase [Schizosaccharomyces japonicus yFS275]